MALSKQTVRARNITLEQIVNFSRATSGTHGSATADTGDYAILLGWTRLLIKSASNVHL